MKRRAIVVGMVSFTWLLAGDMSVGGVVLPSSANLQLWLDAGTGLTQTDDRVSQWDDRSGLGNDLTQADGARQPLYVASAINGLPALRFNTDGRSNDAMVSTTAFLDTRYHSVFAVVKPSQNITLNDIVSTGGLSSGHLLMGRYSPNNARAHYHDGGSLKSANVIASQADLNPSLSYQEVNDFHVVSRWNGGAPTQTSVAAYGSRPTATHPVRLASRSDGHADHWRGDIAEVIVYDVALSAADRVFVENYLSGKYGFGTAGSQVWVGGGTDDNISTPANWSPAAPFAAGNQMVFSGSARTTPNVDAPTAVAGIAFQSQADPFILGGSALTVGANNITNWSTNTQTINNALDLGTDQTWHTVGDLTVAGAVGGGFGITKTGGGTLTLTADNTYSGTTTITAGVLTLQGGNNRISTGNLFIANDAVLNLGGNDQTVWNVGSSGAGNGIVGTVENGNLRFTGNMYVKSGTVSANLSSPGGGGRLWIGGDSSATVLLNGNNTYTSSHVYATIIGHGTTGAAGTVQLGGNNALGTAANRTHLYSGTLDLNGTVGLVQDRISLLSADAVLANSTGAASTSAAIYLGEGEWGAGGKISVADGASLTLDGVVTSNAPTPPTFEKLGLGTLVLNADNPFTGPTIVDAGRLMVNGSTHASSAVTVQANGTLGGTGTVGGPTTVQAGGTLATGNSVGTLNFGSPLTLENGSVWDWQFLNNSAGNYDQAAGPQLVLPTTGAVTFNIQGQPGHSIFPGDRFTVFTGNVENFSPDRVALNNHSKWTSWEMSVGNSLVLTADPTISLSTDVLNAGQVDPGAWNTRGDGYSNAVGVELVRFVDRFSASLDAVAYTQAGTDTIDVSDWVVTSGSGGQRGASQGLQVNGYSSSNTAHTNPGGANAQNLYLRGEPDEYNEGFGAHANWIVTFDLDVIREEHFAGTRMPFQLTGEFGAWGNIGSDDETAGVIQGAIFLDGVRIDSMDPSIANPVPQNLSFDLMLSSGRYLTFGIFNEATSTSWDDGVFKNVNLTMIPEPGT